MGAFLSLFNSDSHEEKAMEERITRRILKEVRRNLTEMKPGLMEELEGRAVQNIQVELNALTNRLNSLENTVSQLQDEVRKAQTETVLKNRSSESRPCAPQGTGGSQETVNGTLTPFVPNDFPGLDDYEVRSGFKFNGWIYYQNPLMGNFLYGVRSNGTENTQLTDYSVKPMGFAKIRGNSLVFQDASFHEHEIPLLL